LLTGVTTRYRSGSFHFSAYPACTVRVETCDTRSQASFVDYNN